MYGENRNRKRLHVVYGPRYGKNDGYWFRVVKPGRVKPIRWTGPFASRRMAYRAGRSW